MTFSDLCAHPTWQANCGSFLSPSWLEQNLAAPNSACPRWMKNESERKWTNVTSDCHQWLSPVSAPFDGLGETESASSAKDPEHSRAPIYAIHYNTWYASESQTKFLNASPHTATYQRRIAKWSRCKCANLCKPVFKPVQTSFLAAVASDAM